MKAYGLGEVEGLRRLLKAGGLSQEPFCLIRINIVTTWKQGFPL